MKSFRFAVSLWALVAATALPAGCGHKGREGDEHGHEESPAGASFQPGKGVVLTEEVREILGVEVADVTQEPLPHVVRFNVQIFGDAHRFASLGMDHPDCEFHGSGSLPPDQAAWVEPNLPVQLLTNTGDTADGFVVAAQNTLVYGETEVVIGVIKAGETLTDGEFVTATITRPRDEAVTVVPSSALLRTSEGTFVYAVNGEAYARTAVKVGGEADGKGEITEGVSPGERVVVKPVQTLWLIELSATKGAGHAH